MKRKVLIVFIFCASILQAQQNLEDLLVAGVNDAQQFTTNYIAPAAEGLIANLANGWVQSAKTKKPLRFELSVVGNASFISKNKQSFLLNTSEYENLYFRDGSTQNQVATAFGQNDPSITMYSVVTDADGSNPREVEFNLPQGLAEVNVNFLPTAFLQARLGVLKGTELKVRFLPSVNYEDVKTSFWGAGIQHDFVESLNLNLPVSISAFVGATFLNGNYNFTSSNVIDGNNQKFKLDVESWLYQLQVGTNWKVFNLYAGAGYYHGKSNYNLLGTYTIQDGTPESENTQTFTDPFQINHKNSGIKGTVGLHLMIAVISLQAQYTVSEFNTASIGVGFGI